MNNRAYVHGYSETESSRLADQARTLTDLLHSDTQYPAGSQVLEAGCGIGAQTILLAKNSPGAHITSVDISPVSIRAAKEKIQNAGLQNVTFQVADLYCLPFPEERFDHIFVCFVLEHLPDPSLALARLRPLLKPGGSLTVIEGDHGSAFFHPDNQEARKAIQCLIDLQNTSGGNALIGRQLYPLVTGAGFSAVSVSPRFVYVDASHQDLVEGFTKQTFTAMVDGVRDYAISQGMMSAEEWDAGIGGLLRTCQPDGVFCYTFFKATGIKK